MTTETPNGPNSLCVIWSAADRDVALELVFMYTINSKIRGWWDNVRLVIWGPSARLLAEDEELLDHIYALQKEGVEVQACKRCADDLGVAEPLEKAGIEVIYMGVPLTDMIKDGWKVLTF